MICPISTEMNGNWRGLGPQNSIYNNRCLSTSPGASLTLNARPKIHLSAVSTMCKRDKVYKSFKKYSYKNNSKLTKKHIVKCSLTNSGAKDYFKVTITEGQGFWEYIRNRQVLFEELLELVLKLSKWERSTWFDLFHINTHIPQTEGTAIGLFILTMFASNIIPSNVLYTSRSFLLYTWYIQ